MVIDQTKIFKEYKGKWVILDNTRKNVLASDNKLTIAVEKFRKKYGSKEIPLTFKVPTEILPYVGSAR